MEKQVGEEEDCAEEYKITEQVVASLKHSTTYRAIIQQCVLHPRSSEWKTRLAALVHSEVEKNLSHLRSCSLFTTLQSYETDATSPPDLIYKGAGTEVLLLPPKPSYAALQSAWNDGVSRRLQELCYKEQSFRAELQKKSPSSSRLVIYDAAAIVSFLENVWSSYQEFIPVVDRARALRIATNTVNRVSRTLIPAPPSSSPQPLTNTGSSGGLQQSLANAWKEGGKKYLSVGSSLDGSSASVEEALKFFDLKFLRRMLLLGNIEAEHRASVWQCLLSSSTTELNLTEYNNSLSMPKFVLQQALQSPSLKQALPPDVEQQISKQILSPSEPEPSPPAATCTSDDKKENKIHQRSILYKVLSLDAILLENSGEYFCLKDQIAAIALQLLGDGVQLWEVDLLTQPCQETEKNATIIPNSFSACGKSLSAAVVTEFDGIQDNRSFVLRPLMVERLSRSLARHTCYNRRYVVPRHLHTIREETVTSFLPLNRRSKETEEQQDEGVEGGRENDRLQKKNPSPSPVVCVASSTSAFSFGAGFSFLCAPLAYLYRDQTSCYGLFQHMYAQFWCKLHPPSFDPSDPDSILSLLCVTETLVTSFHLYSPLPAQPTIGTLPTMIPFSLQSAKIVTQWLLCGFVGFVPVRQVLALFDIIVGLGTLQPMAVLAAGIFLEYFAEEKEELQHSSLVDISGVEVRSTLIWMGKHFSGLELDNL